MKKYYKVYADGEIVEQSRLQSIRAPIFGASAFFAPPVGVNWRMNEHGYFHPGSLSLVEAKKLRRKLAEFWDKLLGGFESPGKYDVVVTQYDQLAEYISASSYFDPSSTQVLLTSDPKKSDVQGKHVAGQLPLHLAAVTRSYTEYTVNLPPDVDWRQMTMLEFAEFISPPRTYYIRGLDTKTRFSPVPCSLDEQDW